MFLYVMSLYYIFLFIVNQQEKIGFSAPETDSQLQLWLKLDRIIYLTIESDFKGGMHQHSIFYELHKLN